MSVDNRIAKIRELEEAISASPFSLSAYLDLTTNYLMTGNARKALQLGERILRARYFELFGHDLDLNRLNGFSEKLFARMILTHRSGNAKFTMCTDKLRVRDYVSQKIGSEYLPRLLWSGGTLKDDFPADLPEAAMLKANDASGRNILIKNGVLPVHEWEKVQSWKTGSHYWALREFHYLPIPHRLLVEEYLEDGSEEGPLDYRFYCFNGRPEVIQIDNRTHSINTFYDIQWNKLNLYYRDIRSEFSMRRPDNLNEMIAVASVLSSDFDFVRVDVYNCHGKIVFGELTFTPTGGCYPFKPPIWDRYLGSQWKFSPTGTSG